METVLKGFIAQEVPILKNPSYLVPSLILEVRLGMSKKLLYSSNDTLVYSFVSLILFYFFPVICPQTTLVFPYLIARVLIS